MVGNMLLNNPWAGSYDATRVKPVAYQGADFTYKGDTGLDVEATDMIWQWKTVRVRTSSQSTLLTSYPAGGDGLASHNRVPNLHCRANCTTGHQLRPGFFMGRGTAGASPATHRTSFALTANLIRASTTS